MPAALDPIYSVDIGVCVVGPGINKKGPPLFSGRAFPRAILSYLGEGCNPRLQIFHYNELMGWSTADHTCQSRLNLSSIASRFSLGTDTSR